MDAELTPGESRGDRRGSQGGRGAKLHPRDRSRSDRESEPPDGLQLFVTDLMKAGLSKDQITTMGREVTGKLLMG